jgi:transposase
VINDHGQAREASIFVAVLGASNYTFVEATWSQRLHDWIGSHERAFAFYGGAPALLVPDNLKSGVTHAHRYEPMINRTYEDLARHYGTAVMPARPRKPKDKAKVENAVLVVSRWILARIRNESFDSLEALNARIGELLEVLNARPFRKLPGSRQSLFQEIERGSLKPLPETRFVTGDWSTARVGLDYHVEIDGHAYSVPHALVRKQVDVRATATTIEIFHGHRRVASHVRSRASGGHSTHPEHQPASHRAHAEWTPRTLLSWAQETGVHVRAVVERMLAEKPHPEQGYRACLGLRGLAKKHGWERLDAACLRALALDDVSLRGIESMLRKGLDRLPLPNESEDLDLVLVHENIRGSAYFRERLAGVVEVEQC